MIKKKKFKRRVTNRKGPMPIKVSENGGQTIQSVNQADRELNRLRQRHGG